MDFEGINLRRKFLTGLEPESINMTIGNDLIALNQIFTLLKRFSHKSLDFSIYNFFLIYYFRFSANSETRCVDRVVIKRENALSCWLSVSTLPDELMTPNLLISRKSMFHCALVTCSILVPSSGVLDSTGAPWTLVGSVGTLVR